MSDIFPFMPYMCVLLQIFSIVQNKSYLLGFFLTFMSLNVSIKQW